MKEGETCKVVSQGFDPDVPGTHSDAKYAGSVVMDQDAWNDDDPMGAMQPHGDSGQLCAEIRNSGGNIFGPNGKKVEGGLHGSGVELYVQHRYTFTKMVTDVITRTVPDGQGGVVVVTEQLIESHEVGVGVQNEGARQPVQVDPC